MSKYYSENRASYFEESGTFVREKEESSVKNAIDSFKKEVEDSKYSVKRPTAKHLGYVRKQD